jgi:ribosome recycling factor
MDTKQYDERFAKVVSHFQEELKKVRTGRAHPDMLASVVVEVYGAKMPLNQVASISAPEPQQLLVTPFDPQNIGNIASNIANNPALGLNPSDDGRVIRIPIPALTEERRKEIVKQLGQKIEDAKIQLRNIREDARKAFKVALGAKMIGENDQKMLEKGIDDSISKFSADVEKFAKEKEAEIMKI